MTTNVIMFPKTIIKERDEAIDRLAKRARKGASAGSNLVWGMLGSALGAIDPGNKDRLERKAKSEQLQALLVHAFTELANHAGQQAAIDFTMSKIKAFRRGCGNE